MADAFETTPTTDRNKLFRKPHKESMNEVSLGDTGTPIPPGAAAEPPGTAAHPIEIKNKSSVQHAKVAWEQIAPGVQNTEGVT